MNNFVNAMKPASTGMNAVTGGLIGTGVSSGMNLLSTLITNNQNKKLQEQAWAREDTAYQRAAADMKAAGLNPLLAAGAKSDSSSSVRMEAPQVGDFGTSFISGKQAKAQIEFQKEQMHQTARMNDQNISNLVEQGRVLEMERMQKAHDLAINIRRDSRSNDTNGLVNQVVQGFDHVMRAYMANRSKIDEGKQKAGSILADTARAAVGAAKKYLPIPAAIGAVKKFVYAQQGKAVPDDPWAVEAKKKAEEKRKEEAKEKHYSRARSRD